MAIYHTPYNIWRNWHHMGAYNIIFSHFLRLPPLSAIFFSAPPTPVYNIMGCTTDPPPKSKLEQPLIISVKYPINNKLIFMAGNLGKNAQQICESHNSAIMRVQVNKCYLRKEQSNTSHEISNLPSTNTCTTACLLNNPSPVHVAVGGWVGF